MSKRIAFITENFTGSILPLTRQLCQSGHYVDIYFFRREINEPEACQLNYKSPHYGINEIPTEAYTNITSYIDSNRLKLFTISQSKPFSSVPIARTIMNWVLRNQARRAAMHINENNYDVVNLVCNYNMSYMTHLLHYLSGNVIVSMHEVCDHMRPTAQPSKLLKEAISKECRIIVFSENSLKNIKNIAGINMQKLTMIPFGLFESYTTFPTTTLDITLPNRYLLFFGYILPYKGLGILTKAVDILGDDLRDFKIIIAGKGIDPVLETIRNDNRYIILSRFIKNIELATMISNAYAVVCPYLTMSQSGIPQTVFPFKVPIIASNLDGFKEIITPDNGLLFTSGSPEALALSIRHLIKCPNQRETMCNNIGNFVTLHPKYAWSNICDKYLQLI